MENNYALLIQRLDAFIRRYYHNLLIRGAIYSTTILLAAYLLFTLLEYFGHFSTPVRATFFFSLLATWGFVLIRYLVQPLAGLLKIGRIISHRQAAQIIGSHFPAVQDKLLNTLQLKDLADHSPQNRDLILASIDQRMDHLKPVPFLQAIDLKGNLKYLRFLLVPLVTLAVILITDASIVKDGTLRLVQYNKQFARLAPFEFVPENETLKAVQNENFQLKVRMQGKEIPAEVYVEIEGKRYKMLRDSADLFSYELQNLQKDFAFNFWADEFYSDELAFEVIEKPVLSAFEVQLDYPEYTGRKDEVIKNAGDISIPQGTRVSWDFSTRNTESFYLFFQNKTVVPERKNNGRYVYQERFLQNDRYYLRIGNSQMNNRDSVLYHIAVQPDAYPAINVEERQDSSNLRTTWFVGQAQDDYGFNKLLFHYRFIKSADEKRSQQRVTIPVQLGGSGNSRQFYHVWDLRDLNIQAGDEIEYYFEVFDNDAVNGSKSSRTLPKVYEVPTEDQIREEVRETSENIKDRLEDAIQESLKLNADMKELQKKLMEKKTLGWQEQKELEELMKRQQELQEEIEKLKKQNELNNQKENEFTPLKEELLQKQQQLEKMFNELFSDELKKMMEELQRLMEQKNKDLLKDQLEKMELSEKDLNKELDRMLELYKKFEVEKNLERSMEKLEKLAEEQEKLAEETEKGLTKPEELKEKQDSLNKEFEKLKEEMDQVDSLNKELEDPMDFDNPEEEMDDIQKDMQEGSEELDKKDKKDAGKKQRQAASKMKKLKQEMDMKKQQEQEEKQAEDYQTLRGILENLVQLSFDQENLMAELRKVNNYNPQFVELVQRQKKIKDDAKMVEDSLLALSKRVVLLQNYINTEIAKVNDNLARSMRMLAERQVSQAQVYQQYTMTSLNNLAVMISEVLKNMQDDMMQSSGSGGGSKKQPKKGNSKNSEKMKQMQQELGEKLKKMKKGMEEGGEQPGSKEWAKMAAQQEMIRRMMEEMKKQMQEEGNGQGAQELQKTIEEMEKLEKDLVNKKLELQTMKRIQEIETRMLEHERAEKEREQDKKRESNEGKQMEKRLPPSLEEYLKQKEKESELLKNLPPELQPYFREKTREYFKNLAN